MQEDRQRDRQTEGQTGRQQAPGSCQQSTSNEKHGHVGIIVCAEGAGQCNTMRCTHTHTHTPWGLCALCHVGGCKTHCLEFDVYSDCGDRRTGWGADKGGDTGRERKYRESNREFKGDGRFWASTRYIRVCVWFTIPSSAIGAVMNNASITPSNVWNRKSK